MSAVETCSAALCAEMKTIENDTAQLFSTLLLCYSSFHLIVQHISLIFQI